MKETRYFYCPDPETSRMLPLEEAEHAVRVLRLKTGDAICVTDGQGHLYDAEITLATRHECAFRIVATHAPAPGWKGQIWIAMAPTKNMDRIEWLAEKATEIGIDRLSFLRCRFSERTVIHTSRIERVGLSAVKQSHKVRIPQLDELMPLGDFISQPAPELRCIAHCYDNLELWPDGMTYLPDLLQANPQTDSQVLVGPEGDFSVEEVQAAIAAGYHPVSLGRSRLRTETAALTAVMMMSIYNRIS